MFTTLLTNHIVETPTLIKAITQEDDLIKAITQEDDIEDMKTSDQVHRMFEAMDTTAVFDQGVPGIDRVMTGGAPLVDMIIQRLKL